MENYMGWACSMHEGNTKSTQNCL